MNPSFPLQSFHPVSINEKVTIGNGSLPAPTLSLSLSLIPYPQLHTLRKLSKFHGKNEEEWESGKVEAKGGREWESGRERRERESVCLWAVGTVTAAAKKPESQQKEERETQVKYHHHNHRFHHIPGDIDHFLLIHTISSFYKYKDQMVLLEGLQGKNPSILHFQWLTNHICQPFGHRDTPTIQECVARHCTSLEQLPSSLGYWSFVTYSSINH